MAERKLVAVVGATGAQGGGLARAPIPELQDFANWLAANADRIPIE